MSPPVASLHDPARVAQILGLRFSPHELSEFGPPPPATDGFVTFFDPGASILWFREAAACRDAPFTGGSWYNHEPFACRRDPPQYRQIRRAQLPRSSDKSFDEQYRILPPDEEVCTARVVVAAALLHSLAIAEPLLSDGRLRCLDLTSAGDRVYVGGFNPCCLDLGRSWDFFRSVDLGLAIVRKLATSPV